MVFLRRRRNKCYEHYIHMFGKFISHTPAEYNSCVHLCNFFHWHHIHTRLSLQSLSSAPAGINSTQTRTGNLWEKPPLRHWPCTCGWNIKLHQPTVCRSAHSPTATHAQLTITSYYMYLAVNWTHVIVMYWTALHLIIVHIGSEIRRL